MVRCLTGARFTMTATRLTPVGEYTPQNPDEYGQWVDSQDPLTFETVRVWQPATTTSTQPSTVNSQEFSCLARGIVDGGIRVAGTTERFGEMYENIDYVKLWTPPNVLLTKRDRVTNIKMPNGHIVWVDEEAADGTRATVFNVNGVTPLFDAFNRHVENYVMLERAQFSD